MNSMKFLYIHSLSYLKMDLSTLLSFHFKTPFLSQIVSKHFQIDFYTHIQTIKHSSTPASYTGKKERLDDVTKAQDIQH